MGIGAFLGEVLSESWAVLLESAPYLLFGFAVAGLVQGLVPAEAIAKHLGKGRLSSVLKAALFGIPLPLCSCGVVPAAVNLRRNGASRGAVVSFLVSAPETGLDSIALSWALLGPVLAVFRPLSAFLSAVLAGVVENFARAEDVRDVPPPSCGCSVETAPQGSFLLRLRSGLGYAFGDLLKDLAPWLGAGFLLAGVIGAVIPEGFIGRYLSAGPLAYFAMLAVGIPLYICATASTPVAAALLLKGLSPGAALIFLLAGPATNAASLTALAGTLGFWTTVRYVAAIAVVSVGMGALLDFFYVGTGGAFVPAAGGELFSPAVSTACAVAVIVLSLRPYLRVAGGRRQACSGAS